MNDDLVFQEEPRSFFRHLFVGNQGIRAGWSIGIFFLLMGLFTALFIMPTIHLLEGKSFFDERFAARADMCQRPCRISWAAGLRWSWLGSNINLLFFMD